MLAFPRLPSTYRTDHDRIADAIGDGLGLTRGSGDAVFRLEQPKLVQQDLEPLSVLGDVDLVRRGPENRNSGFCQRQRQFQRRLPAVLDDATQDRAGVCSRATSAITSSAVNGSK